MTDEALKLQRFKEAVSADIDAQVSRMLDEAQQECDSMMNHTRITVSRHSEEERESLRTASELSMTRRISAARLEAQRSVLRKRSELAEGVFEKVKTRLAEFRRSSAYADWLKKAVSSAQEKYPGKKAFIRLAPEDMKYADALDLPADEDASILLGGVTVGFEGISAVIDCTFDAMLEKERSEFSSNSGLASDDRE